LIQSEILNIRTSLESNKLALSQSATESNISDVLKRAVEIGHVARIRCQADLNSFPLGELEETTGMPTYYVYEDYPAGPGIIEPLPE